MPSAGCLDGSGYGASGYGASQQTPAPRLPDRDCREHGRGGDVGMVLCHVRICREGLRHKPQAIFWFLLEKLTATPRPVLEPRSLIYATSRSRRFSPTSSTYTSSCREWSHARRTWTNNAGSWGCMTHHKYSTRLMTSRAPRRWTCGRTRRSWWSPSVSTRKDFRAFLAHLYLQLRLRTWIACSRIGRQRVSASMRGSPSSRSTGLRSCSSSALWGWRRPCRMLIQMPSGLPSSSVLWSFGQYGFRWTPRIATPMCTGKGFGGLGRETLSAGGRP